MTTSCDSGVSRVSDDEKASSTRKDAQGSDGQSDSVSNAQVFAGDANDGSLLGFKNGDDLSSKLADMPIAPSDAESSIKTEHEPAEASDVPVKDLSTLLKDMLDKELGYLMPTDGHVSIFELNTSKDPDGIRTTTLRTYHTPLVPSADGWTLWYDRHDESITTRDRDVRRNDEPRKEDMDLMRSTIEARKVKDPEGYKGEMEVATRSEGRKHGELGKRTTRGTLRYLPARPKSRL